MTSIVGIDLGTTNSGVSIVQNGVPVMLPNGDARITPSVVGYTPDGRWLVGTPARNQYIFDPDSQLICSAYGATQPAVTSKRTERRLHTNSCKYTLAAPRTQHTLHHLSLRFNVYPSNRLQPATAALASLPRL